MLRRGFILPALTTGILMSVVSCSPFMIRKYFGRTNDTTPVRVLIHKTGGQFTVSSVGDLSLSGIRADVSRTFRGSTAGISASAITGKGTIKSSRPPLCLNGRPYRGTFEVHNKNGVALVVNILSMDEYLYGVVPSEIPAGWEMEALKAQAVASRTYAYYHLQARTKSATMYDVDATTNSQVYRGMSEEKERTSEAVAGTSGQIISHNHMPIVAYFHSTCGGKTVDDRYVWPKTDLSYLRGVTCGYCESSTKYSWQSRISLEEIHDCLSKKHANVGRIKNIRFKRKGDRVTEVLVNHTEGTIRLTGNNFRLLFPVEKMRSLYFTSKKSGKSLLLTGKGWGHGVGMCQWGARGMALRGHRYTDILKHYYSDVTISHVRSAHFAQKIRR